MIRYIRNKTKLEEVANALRSYKKQVVGFDTETTGLCPHTSKVRLAQFGIDNDCYVIDCFFIDIAKLQQLFDIIRTNECTVAGHNLKFDIKMLWANSIDIAGIKLFDTMLASKVIEAGLDSRHSLDEVATRYLGRYVSKDLQTSDWSALSLSKDQIRYAALDVQIMRPLVRVLKAKLKLEELVEVFKLEMRTLPCTAAMEFYGVRVDTSIINEKLKPLYEERLLQSEQKFLSCIKDRFVRANLNNVVIDEGLQISSSSQVLKALQKLNIPDPLEPELPIQSTSKTHIKLLDITKYPAIEALLDYRTVAKLLTSYIYSLPDKVNPVTGRIHPDFNQIVSTGRFSSSNPNLQQIPRPNKEDEYSIRTAFIPEDGFIFCQNDFSQIELRVIAEVIYNSVGDKAMLQEFIDGKDPYGATAAALANMEYDEFIKLEDYKKRRQNAKAIRLGFNYGMGATKFKNYAKYMYNVTFTDREAKLYRDKYFNLYKGLKQYHDTCSDKNRTTAYSLPPFKRRRMWIDYPGTSALANHPIQGSSADITKLAMAKLYKSLENEGFSPVRNTDVRPVLTIHDEIVVEATHEHKEWASKLLQTCMVEAAKVVLKICPVEAESNLMNSLAEK